MLETLNGFTGQSIFGNSLAAWLIAIAVALSINIAAAVIRWVLVTRLAKRAARTETWIDDAVVKVAKSTRQWLIFFAAISFAVVNLELPARVERILEGVGTVATFIQLGLWAGALLEFYLGRTRARAMATDMASATSLAALSFIGRMALWAVVVLLTLDNLGVNITALVAGLGVGGIAVALAVQNILGDLFASLSIVIDKPFVLGDFIIVENHRGTVLHIGLKTTRVKSLDGEEIIFSNSDLLKARVRNNQRMVERRVLFTFGVTYDTQPDQLERIARRTGEIIRSIDKARFDRAHFFKFGDSSLDFEVVYFVLSADYAIYMNVQQSINLALIRMVAEEKSGFAFPTRTLVVDGPVPALGDKRERPGE